MSERRKDIRVDCQVPLKICQEDGDIVTETGNISRSGAYCRVNRYIEPMTKLQTHLLLPIKKSNGKTVTKKISCQGIIVRTEQQEVDGKYKIAIFFNDINQRDSEVISEYIHRHHEQHSNSYN